jgi:hypothetical protein
MSREPERATTGDLAALADEPREKPLARDGGRANAENTAGLSNYSP